MAVHVWPSLHSLMPGNTPHDIPEVFDTGVSYEGMETGFTCSHDITTLMQHGLFRMKEMVAADKLDPGSASFADFVSDRTKNVMSHYDGGQLMYNFVMGDKAILFNTHLGAYEGILRCVEPKPDIAVLGAGGRANLNGRPFAGSAAEFITGEVTWLGEPSQVFFSLHDDRQVLNQPCSKITSTNAMPCSIIKPYRTETTAAEKAIKEKTSSEIIITVPATVYSLFK